VKKKAGCERGRAVLASTLYSSRVPTNLGAGPRAKLYVSCLRDKETSRFISPFLAFKIQRQAKVHTPTLSVNYSESVLCGINRLCETLTPRRLRQSAALEMLQQLGTS